MAKQPYFRPDAFRVNPTSTAQQSPTRLSGGFRGQAAAPMQQAPDAISTAQVDQEAAINQATFKAVSGMAQAALEPYVERKQQELFYEGARRQIEGEALADIVDSQPWYSKIFGPSASVQGARKMAQLRAVDEVVNGMAAEMPELRRLNPDEFQAELFNRADSVLTGDEQSDAIIQAQILESSQPLIRTHTKEHYAFGQEQMQEEFTKSSVVNAEQLQRGADAYQRGIMSEDDWNQLRLKAANSLQPLEGQTEDSYFNSVYASGQEAMQTGKWHYVKMLEDAGIVDAMPVEMRTRFRDAKRTYESRSLSDLAMSDYHVELAQLTAQSRAGRISPNELMKRVESLNAEVKKRTGIDRPFLDAGDVTGLVQGNLQGIYEAQRRARDEAKDAQAKQAALVEKQRLIGMAIGTGNIGNLVSAGAVSGTDAQATGTSIIKQHLSSGDNQWQPLVVNSFNQSGFKFNYLSSEIQRGMRASEGEDFNAAWQYSMNLYAALNEQPGGQAAASAYAGEYAPQMQQAYEMMHPANGQGVPADVAYNRVMKAPQQVNLTETERSTVEDAVNERFGAGLLDFGAPELDQHSRNIIVEEVAEPMRRYSGTSLTAEEQLDRAWPEVSSRVDILGSRVARKNPADPKLSDVLKTNTRDAGLTFDTTLSEKMQELGISDDATLNIQQQRNNGQISYFVESYDDGEFNYFMIDQDELQGTFKDRIEQLRKKAEIRPNFGNNPIPYSK